MNILVSLLCCLATVSALAQLPVVPLQTFTAPSGAVSTPFITNYPAAGTLRSDFTGRIGYQLAFVQNNSFTVTALGRYIVTGNSHVHTIYFYKNTTLVASANLNTALGTGGTFLYTNVTPFSVSVSNGDKVYIESDEVNAQDQWHNACVNNAFIEDGRIVVSTIVPSNGEIASPCASGRDGYVIPNFLFTIP